MSNVNTTLKFPKVTSLKELRDDGDMNPAKREKAISQAAREQMVHHQKLKLMKQDLHDCYMAEGVNHIQNCRTLAIAYLEAFRMSQPYEPAYK